MYATQSVCYFMSLQNHSWYINWHQSVQNSHSTYYQHWINSTQHDPRWAKRQCLWCSTAFPGVLQERKQHKTDCLCRHHWAVSQQVMSRHIISMTARHSTYIYMLQAASNTSSCSARYRSTSCSRNTGTPSWCRKLHVSSQRIFRILSLANSAENLW